jgi:hypothetical protein
VERAAGREFILQNGPDRVLFWSRLPFILLATGLGALLFLWTRRLLGDWAALGAVFLYTLDPNIIAHAQLVTMDLGFAAFALLFAAALWYYSESPTTKRAALAGLALGAMLSAKFTGVFLLPLAIFYARRNIRHMTLMVLIAAGLVQVLYLSPGGLYLYQHGITQVNADHDPNYQVFLGGRFSHWFPEYFAAAWALKEPIATLVLCIAGMWLLPRPVKAWALAPALILFAAHTAFADDLGVRYLLPVLPFLYIGGGYALTRLPRPAVAVLGMWVAVNAAGIYPDHLSFFNESACLLSEPSRVGLDAGTACGPAWLDDSNVDWGQGAKQLAAWLNGRPAHVMWFGSFPVQAYGVRADDLPQLPQNPPPGLYAISAHYVARAPAEAWVKTTRPAAIVGHAVYIYNVPPKRE